MSVNSRLKATKFMNRSKESILQAENSSLAVQGKKQTVDIYIHMGDNLKSDNHCLPQHKGDGFSWVIIITLMVLGKP